MTARTARGQARLGHFGCWLLQREDWPLVQDMVCHYCTNTVDAAYESHRTLVVEHQLWDGTLCQLTVGRDPVGR